MRELTLMRVLKAFVAAFAVLLAVSAAVAQDRPRVVTVNYPLAYFAERLLGDAAEVVFPVPADIDPSFWRPSIADISLIQSADLILLNGAGFATWVDRVSLPRSRLVNTTSAIRDRFIVTESITHSHGDGGEHSHEGVASYTWLDPTLAIKQAEAVAAAIATRNLAPADEVYARFAELRADLERLEADTEASLDAAQDVPMIATHPRYQYLARGFGLSIAALEWEAGTMPSAEDLTDLEALTGESGAGILIWEAEPPADAVAAVAALGIQSVVFPPMAHRLADGTFIDGFRASVSALADAASQVSVN